jgi:hypothetical protein
MITQREALDRFIRERVLGDRGFGIDLNGECVFNHENNGGCEIGQYLSRADAERVTGYCSETPVREAMRRAELEQAHARFWTYLQRCHDAMARFSRRRDWDAWEMFQLCLREAARFAVEPESE